LKYFRTDEELHYENEVTSKNVNLTRLEDSNEIKVDSNGHPNFKMQIQSLDPPQDHKITNFPYFLIHTSDLLPTFIPRDDFIELNYGYDFEVEIVPEIIKTDKSLMKLNPDLRECYFDNERSLRFFRTYTQKNCEIECFTNHTIQKCGCVSLDQPYNPAKNISLCYDQSILELNCHLLELFHLIAQENFSIERDCSCYPTCDSISYHTKYKYTKINGNETTISVRMNTDDIILYRRYQQYTFSDIVSYIGGLLGLFAGISMLSIVELFYFFSLRLCGSAYKYLQ
jgi:acid-sensing ion channel, other